jgi:uncharacterized repeat protein (TIGR01451 family)
VFNKIVIAILGACVSAAACAATYTYTGLPFNFVSAPYTTSMSITGSFTTASPLPANMPITDIGPNGSNLVTAWSFNDGINTYTMANSVVLPQPGTFRIATDASGSITQFYIQMQQPLPPHTVGQLLNVLDVVNIGFNQSQGTIGSPCLTLSGTICATLGPGASFGDSASSGSFAALQADLAITKTGPASLTPGSNATYTLGVSSTGPDAAANVSLTDALPPGTTFVSFTAPGGWITTTPAVGGTGTVTATNTSLASGASASFTLVVNVNAGTPVGTTISNTATVASATADPTPGNNAATSTGTVGAALQADVGVSKTGPASVTRGSNATYNLVVTNAGPDAAANVSLTDVLPPGTTFVSMTAPGGWTTTTPAVGGTGAVTATNASLASGASAAFTLVANVTSGTPVGTAISNTATVASATTDLNPDNNASTATMTVSAVAPPSQPIPTLSEGILVALVLLLALLGAAAVRRDQ